MQSSTKPPATRGSGYPNGIECRRAGSSSRSATPRTTSASPVTAPAGASTIGWGLALHKIEELADDAEKRRCERERREGERRAAHQRALERATDRYREAKRGVHLRAQVENWKHVNDIRAFVAQVRVGASGCSEIDVEWLDWALGYADTVDPTRAPVRGPVLAAPKPADLESFFDGWSPYGP